LRSGLFAQRSLSHFDNPHAIGAMFSENYAWKKPMAASENRSVSQRVIYIVKSYLARKNQLQAEKTPAEVLLELSGSWEDSREAQEIIREIREARLNCKKNKEGF
jgi:hypothetical protein